MSNLEQTDIPGWMRKAKDLGVFGKLDAYDIVILDSAWNHRGNMIIGGEPVNLDIIMDDIVVMVGWLDREDVYKSLEKLEGLGLITRYITLA